MSKENTATKITVNTRSPAAEFLISEASLQRLRGIAAQGLDFGSFLNGAIVAANGLGDDVNENSVLQAALDCAQLGLMPGAGGQAYFLPFRNKKHANRKECQLVPGYRGFVELGYRSGFLANIDADVVLKGEDYRHEVVGNVRDFTHGPIGLDRDLIWENIEGAYCTWRTTTDETGVRVVTRPELERANTKRNVWASEPAEMCKKTAIRRAAKLWRQTPDLNKAIDLDEAFEVNAIASKIAEELRGPSIPLGITDDITKTHIVLGTTTADGQSLLPGQDVEGSS